MTSKWYMSIVVLALSGVACGALPPDTGVQEKSSALTSYYAIRFWSTGLCLDHSGSTLKQADCSFSAPDSQKWAFGTTSIGFTVQTPGGSGGCLTDHRTYGAVESCDGSLNRNWHIPGRSGVPNFSTFKLQGLSGSCLTSVSPNFVDEETCATSGPVSDRQTLMLDTF